MNSAPPSSYCPLEVCVCHMLHSVGFDVTEWFKLYAKWLNSALLPLSGLFLKTEMQPSFLQVSLVCKHLGFLFLNISVAFYRLCLSHGWETSSTDIHSDGLKIFQLLDCRGLNVWILVLVISKQTRMHRSRVTDLRTQRFSNRAGGTMQVRAIHPHNYT